MLAKLCVSSQTAIVFHSIVFQQPAQADVVVLNYSNPQSCGQGKGNPPQRILKFLKYLPK